MDHVLAGVYNAVDYDSVYTEHENAISACRKKKWVFFLRPSPFHGPKRPLRGCHIRRADQNGPRSPIFGPDQNTKFLPVLDKASGRIIRGPGVRLWSARGADLFSCRRRSTRAQLYA